MSTMTTDASTSTAPPLLEWRAFPAKQRPGRAALGIVIILAIGAMTGGLFHADGFSPATSVGMGLLASAILVLVLQRFYFPSFYAIDAEGITARTFLSTLRLRWTEIRRFLHDETGGFLSTRAVPSRLDSFQGLHIVFGEDAPRAIRTIEERLRLARGDDA
ncbi:MAG: hypothetical protein KJZ68_02540 [Phycisphaerales bacterium]|nr:hypothetical protein [Phycisphaerales bacterium]